MTPILPDALANASAICVPVRSSLTSIKVIFFSSYRASKSSIVADPIKPKTYLILLALRHSTTALPPEIGWFIISLIMMRL